MLAKINKALKQKCEEWEVPFECGDLSPLSGDAKSGDKSPHSKEAQKMVHQWWDLRRDRQKEIDASIARRADRNAVRPTVCGDEKGAGQPKR